MRDGSADFVADGLGLADAPDAVMVSAMRVPYADRGAVVSERLGGERAKAEQPGALSGFARARAAASCRLQPALPGRR